MVEFAFLEMWVTCLLQERLQIMVTPRYFASALMASFWPWMKWALLVCYAQHLTFVLVEGHLPLLPFLLKQGTISLVCYLLVKYM